MDGDKKERVERRRRKQLYNQLTGKNLYRRLI